MGYEPRGYWVNNPYCTLESKNDTLVYEIPPNPCKEGWANGPI